MIYIVIHKCCRAYVVIVELEEISRFETEKYWENNPELIEVYVDWGHIKLSEYVRKQEGLGGKKKEGKKKEAHSVVSLSVFTSSVW